MPSRVDAWIAEGMPGFFRVSALQCLVHGSREMQNTLEDSRLRFFPCFPPPPPFFFFFFSSFLFFPSSSLFIISSFLHSRLVRARDMHPVDC